MKYNNPNFNSNYMSAYDQYKDFEPNHELLGFIDGLAMCCDIIDESPRCYSKGNSVYDHGFDGAMKNMFEFPDIARNVYRDLISSLDERWAEHCKRVSK